MTSIGDVPYEDIKLFLKRNNIRISSNEKNNYNEVFKIIKAGKGQDYPDSLIDWIIAYNLLTGKIHVNRYSVADINLANKRELNELAESLGIFDSNDNKQSVLNVLRYLKKLDSGIVNKDIDSYVFSLMQNIDEQKILSSSYQDIIKLFQKNKTLRKFIYDNMRRIIFPDHPIYDGQLLLNGSLDIITEFIVDLMKMKEIILVKEVLKQINDLLNDQDQRSDFISDLHFSILYTNDDKIIEDYFRLLNELEF